VQKGRFTVQFKDEDFHARLLAMAKSRGLCVATLIRLYTADGLRLDERTRVPR
jgi:hypothetical protein